MSDRSTDPHNPQDLPKQPIDNSEEATIPPRSRVGGSEDETLAPKEPDAQSLSGLPQISGYEIQGELGRGGMGVVYRAKHLKLNRMVALKMILSGGHASESDLERFASEARAVASLQHPNIIQIHEVGSHEGKPYCALEFCSDGSLDDQLDGAPWEVQRAVTLVRTLAEGMHTAHAQKIIHRDLKPANILLTRESVPKITDFGLAKKLDEVGQTASGAIMGTPAYMAPEQAEGKSENLGPHTDVYALGAILYELLTGRAPFRGADAMSTILQVLSNEPVPPSQIQPGLPRDIETICMACLQKKPDQRYDSALALAEDLRRFQELEPIHAQPPTLFDLLVKWTRRHPGVAVLAALLFLVLLIAIPVFVGRWQLAVLENAQFRQQIESENTNRAQLIQKGIFTFRRDLEQKIRKLENEKRRLERRPAKPAVTVVKFDSKPGAVTSSSQKYMASQFTGVIKLWSLETQKLLRTFAPASGPTVFSPGENHFALISEERSIEIWDLKKLKQVRLIPLPESKPYALAFSPDNRLLAVGYQNGSIDLHDVAEKRIVREFRKLGQPVLGVTFSPNGKQLHAVGSHKKWVWNLQTK